MRSPAERVTESVWSYPRPPRVEPLHHHARVEFDGRIVADSVRALRVLETSHPPTIYFPAADVQLEWLKPAPGSSICEWKGQASYWNLEGRSRSSRSAAWSYRNPTPRYQQLKDHVAFYPGRVDACYLDDKRVEAQEGDFYGGWITADIVGPLTRTRWVLGLGFPLILVGTLEVFGVWAFGGWGDPENLAGRIAWLAALPALFVDFALLVCALRTRTTDD